MTRVLRAVPAVLAVLALSACFTSAKGADVPVFTTDDTIRQVNVYAEQIAAAAGASLADPAVSYAPCEGRAGELSKDVYTVAGNYFVTVPYERHAPVIAAVGDQWRQRGYTVTSRSVTPPDDGVEIVARTPDGYRLRLVPTDPPSALSLLVSSPCFRSPTRLY